MLAHAETARVPLVGRFEPHGVPDSAAKAIGSHQATRAQLRTALLAHNTNNVAVVTDRDNTRPLENLHSELARSGCQTA